MKLYYFILLGLWMPISLLAQSRNYVPNHSFEEVYNLPIKPNPKNTFEYEPKSGYKPFEYNLKHWYAGSETTPDLRISSRASYSECQKRYGTCDRARTGDYTVGIITSMTNTYTDSYREYIQVKLGKTLKPGLKTYVELWVVKERQAKLVSNNIGVYFSAAKWHEDTEEVVKRVPQINCDTLLNTEKQEWVKIEGSFVSEFPLRYMTIGNFFDNENTKAERCKYYSASPYIPPYAYYLIDDVKVWQDEPEKEETSEESILDITGIEKDRAVRLNNITFEFDSAILKDSSYTELNLLLSFLKSRPTVRIAIHGHTDNAGAIPYNLELSRDRAKAVYDFLLEKGIAAERLSYTGFGESQPVLSNDTDEGRSENRRVEFVIL